MSILTAIQRAAVLCGLPLPTSAVSSPDATIRQLVAFAFEEGEDLAVNFDWRNLKVALQVNGDGIATQFALAPDFDRFLTINPLWSNASTLTPMRMVADDEMLRLRTTGPSPAPAVWRLLGTALEFYPALGATEVVTGEYRSNRWIIRTDNVTRNVTFMADTDVCLVPEALIALGAVWRWKQSKGLEYAEDFRNAQTQREIRAGHDRGARPISMSRVRLPDPDTFFPGTIVPLGPVVA